jgi:hypothetical protein
MSSAPMRGQVHRVSLTSAGPQPYVIVSNNVRNRNLDSVLAVLAPLNDLCFGDRLRYGVQVR